MDAPNISPSAYGIRVVPANGQAVATLNGTVIARSDRALTMTETRLPAILYIPREDVLVPLRPHPEKRNFCPFKGTATYWDLELCGETTPAAAWSYDTPLRDAAPVSGHVAFDGARGINVTVAGTPPATPQDSPIAGPLVDWLMRKAPLIDTPEALTAALGETLNAVGICVSRLTVLAWSLHPLIAGRHYVWTRHDGAVDVRSPSYDFIDQEKFANSPLRHVAYRLGGVRQRLDTEDKEFAFPFMNELRQEGATDYVAMPLIGASGFGAPRFNVLTLVGDHRDGFTTANLGHVYECAFTIARLYEAFTQRENFTAILDTYLGHRTGARVLAGEIRRGDGDAIDAAILFCDLRGSTALQARLPRDQFFALLNDFFEIANAIVVAHGGEVLKLIGDAVMAVFPSDDSRERACRSALNAARDIVANLAARESEALECAIGIAFGNVIYGNIGSRERLDFTVVGAAANIAARLSDFGKVAGHPIVAAASVIECSGGTASTPLGAVDLHGVPSPTQAHAMG